MQASILKTITCSLLTAAAITTTSHANGYKILCVKSAKATSMGEAFIVQADDPTAVAFNPAGLAQLRGNQVNLHATICNAYTEHRGPSGTTSDSVDKWQTVPSVFATTDMGRQDMAVGLGISFPNGLSSEWKADGFARYVATYSELIVADISPAIGVRLSDNLLVGGGLSFYYSEALLENMLDIGATMGMPGMVDMKSKLQADGTSWGFNAGLIYNINAHHALAATYHHAFSVDYDGDLSFAGARNDVTASIDFPAAVVLGYAFKPTERWHLEFNADWTHWNAADDITVEFDTPGMPTQAMQQDLENTVAYKFGAEYAYTDTIALRCGYIYNENATPDETWRPSLPDTDMHFLTAGLGYKLKRTTIDTALQFVSYETRKIDNNVDFNESTSSSSVDGTYRTWAPCFSISATYEF